MPREIQEPSKDEYGADTHPAFGVAKINTFSSSRPGVTFFDSEIQHEQGVVFTVYRATRTRQLHSDRIHQDGPLPLIEIEMSQAQWGALVSAFGNGNGVPVTIRATENNCDVPGIPYAPRMALQVAETRDAAKNATQCIQDALDRFKAAEGAKARREALSSLQAAVNNLPSSLTFAEKQLTEHVETTVTKAKADIEAMVLRHAKQLGIDPTGVVAPLQIEQ